MKECTNCKTIKNFNEFNLDATSKSGYQSRCRICCKIYKDKIRQQLREQGRNYYSKNREHYKKHREDNKEHYKQYLKKYKQVNKDRIEINNIKYRTSLEGKYLQLIRSAKDREIEVNISFDEYINIIKDNKCFYAGCDISNTGGSSLNRVDSNKGYFLGNVKPCCRTCNVIMNEFKAEDLIDRLYKIADTLKKQITKER